MSDSIRLENIRVNQKASDWEDAIRIAGNLLVECGSITPEYIDNMIQNVHELGPYIVLMPQFALAHAAPCEAVKKSDMSIITLQDEVDFHSDNGPVQIVLCLACTDQESHIERLQSIAVKLMMDDMIDKICACQDAEELYHLLND